MERIAMDFEQEFKVLYRPLCLFALQYIPRTEDAEDIVQQAFADVWEKLCEGASILNMKAYMYQAVKNSRKRCTFVDGYRQTSSGKTENILVIQT